MGKKADEYIASRVNSVIGKGTEFEGTIRTKETIRIEGFVKGNIISDGTVIIGNGGNVDGKEITMHVEAGQKGIYSKYAGTEVKVDGEELIIVRQSDILAIVE